MSAVWMCVCVHEQITGVPHCQLRAAAAEKTMETSAIWNVVRNLWSAKMFSPQGGPKPAASATVSHLVQSLWALYQATMAREIHTQQHCIYKYFFSEIQKYKRALLFKHITSDCETSFSWLYHSEIKQLQISMALIGPTSIYPPILQRILLHWLHLTSF